MGSFATSFYRWLLLCLVVLCQTSAAVPALFNGSLPSHITLRAGVLHAPPFAMIYEHVDGTLEYSGFQLDLLERLQIFAQGDNVTLSFDLGRSPSQYGAALDLIANDCSADINENGQDDCNRFDLIVGDYYVNPDSSLRIDFTPSWLSTTMSTVKYVGENQNKKNNKGGRRRAESITTLTQAASEGASVCVPDGTYLMSVVMDKFPTAEYLKCPSTEDCLESLRHDECVLYADDELLLHYRASLDLDLEMTREQFSTQYLVWPLRHDLDPTVALYMKKWVYSAVANGTMDELYSKYFQEDQCPVGRAGEQCEKPCDPVHGTADSRGVCVCESIKWTGEDCSIEVPEDTHMISTTLKGVSYGMMGINYLIIVLCGIWLFSHRNSAQVRVSQPFFLALVLLGCGISSSTILAIAQENEGDEHVQACMAIPWLYSVGFSITFGTLYAKIRRVFNMFKNAAATPRGVRKTAGTIQETLVVIGVVLLIDVLVLVAWTVVSPLEWVRCVHSQDQFGTPLESHGFCTSDDWKIFAGLIGALHLVLLGMASYKCFEARDIPTRFSEGKYVSIAMLSNLQIFIVGVPILIVLGDSPESTFFVRSIVIWMNDFVVVTLIFGNLIYSVHFQVEEAEPEAVKAAIGQAIQNFSAVPGSGRRASRLDSQHTSTTARSPDFSRSGSGNLAIGYQRTSSEEQRRISQERRHSSDASGQEITLTQSELEEVNPSLRCGEPNIMLFGSRLFSQNVPLPRSMFSSSISTQVHSNLRDVRVSVLSNDVSTATVASLPPSHSQVLEAGSIIEGDEEEPADEREAVDTALMPPSMEIVPPVGKEADVLKGDRTSWGGIKLPTLSNVQDLDEEGGGGGDSEITPDNSQASISSSTRLPPANLPKDGPTRLSYAASRINDVRGQREKTWRDGGAQLSTESESTKGDTIATGCESFHDETDLDKSMHQSRPDTKTGAYDRRKSVDVIKRPPLVKTPSSSSLLSQNSQPSLSKISRLALIEESKKAGTTFDV